MNKRVSKGDALAAQALDLHRQGQVVLAEIVYRQAIQVDPVSAKAQFGLGLLLHQLGRHEAAGAAFARAAELKTDWVDAHMNAGVALYEAKQFEEAHVHLERAFALEPSNADLQLNLGNVLVDLNRHQEAIELFRGVIERSPKDAGALMNMANVLRDLRRFDDASSFYDRALAIAPQNADIHFNLSLCMLTRGDYENGWREYEWRLQIPSLHDTTRIFRAPLPPSPGDGWNRGMLNGNTILLYAEQGLGDTIHICRYAALVTQLGARVILEAQRPLHGILKCMVEDQVIARLIAPKDDPGACDYRCPLMSLPFLFGTTLDTVPAAIPYLRAEPERVQRWGAQLVATPGLKVGLAWSGNAAFRNNHQRSLALATLLRALPPEAQVWSLQKDVSKEDLLLIEHSHQMNRFDENDFVDTAAQIMALDVVVCVETSIAQLAAALGKPTWVLLSTNSDWRWLHGRDDSPWYPNVRLFRQTVAGDWTDVLERIRQGLSGFAETMNS